MTLSTASVFRTASTRDTGTTDGQIPVIGTGDVLPVSVIPVPPDATDTQSGPVRLSTNAEVATGTSTTTAVTPSGLAAQQGVKVIVLWNQDGPVQENSSSSDVSFRITLSEPINDIQAIDTSATPRNFLFIKFYLNYLPQNALISRQVIFDHSIASGGGQNLINSQLTSTLSNFTSNPYQVTLTITGSIPNQQIRFLGLFKVEGYYI